MNIIQIIIKKEICNHFWHYMMGEFLPVLYLIFSLEPDKVILYNPNRKWNGPFDNFYKEIHQNIIFSNKLTKNIKKCTYNSWDYKINKNEKNKCLFVIEYLKNLSFDKFGIQHKNKILCLYRDVNEKLDNYFLKQYGNNKYGYTGGKRRSYKNIKEIDKFIDNILYINTDNLPILEQISHFILHNKIILEHGAGMFFCLFMQDNTKIIEIIPPSKYNKKNGAVQGLKRIIHLKKFQLRRIILENKEDILQKKDDLILLNKHFFY
jgi:hypothetical protein